MKVSLDYTVGFGPIFVSVRLFRDGIPARDADHAESVLALFLFLQ